MVPLPVANIVLVVPSVLPYILKTNPGYPEIQKAVDNGNEESLKPFYPATARKPSIAANTASHLALHPRRNI